MTIFSTKKCAQSWNSRDKNKFYSNKIQFGVLNISFNKIHKIKSKRFIQRWCGFHFIWKRFFCFLARHIFTQLIFIGNSVNANKWNLYNAKGCFDCVLLSMCVVEMFEMDMVYLFEWCIAKERVCILISMRCIKCVKYHTIW